MKRIYILTLMALLTLSMSAQTLRFYKYGKEVLSLNTADVDSLAMLSAEEHPANPYLHVEQLTVEPDEVANRWNVSLNARSRYEVMLSLSEQEMGFDSLEQVVERWQRLAAIYGEDVYEFKQTLPSQMTYYLYLKITKDDVPFYEKVKIETGYSLADAIAEHNIVATADIDGHKVAYSASLLEAFFLAHADLLGEYYTALAVNIVPDLNDYLRTQGFSRLATSTIDYHGGTLYLLTSIPDGAADYIQQKRNQRLVLPMAGYEVPSRYGEETMSVDSTSCKPEWNAPWEEYLTVMSKSASSQTEITFTTPTLVPGRKYDLYITMAAEELPIWFAVSHQKMQTSGGYSSATYYDNPSPVTDESDIPNADVILKLSKNQRCFPTGTDGCYRILVQRGIAPTYTSPMKLTVSSWGPSSTTYREVVYTRTLRIAGIELVPSEGED